MNEIRVLRKRFFRVYWTVVVLSVLFIGFAVYTNAKAAAPIHRYYMPMMTLTQTGNVGDAQAVKETGAVYRIQDSLDMPTYGWTLIEGMQCRYMDEVEIDGTQFKQSMLFGNGITVYTVLNGDYYLMFFACIL